MAVVPKSIDPPPSSAVTADPLPPIPIADSKLRLMCSFGGHIVPRPQGKSLIYAGGETRIVGLDRRTTAVSLSSLTSHLSRTFYNNRPFHLRYQLPNEDLDSLISVTTDDDLQNMLEEHDRVSSIKSSTPSRIRLFIFPVKPESLGSVLLDPKADSWFSDALKNTRIVQRGHSADSGLGHELLGMDIMGGSDSNLSLDARGESLSNSGGGGGGGEAKGVGGVPESLVLETSSSFGSTSSSISMSNAPAIGVQSEDSGTGLLEKKIRVPSSASIESDNSFASSGFQPKAGIYQEPIIQVASGVPSYTAGMESSFSAPQSMIHMQKTVQLSGYQLSQQSDGKHQQCEQQYIQGGTPYMPQYPSGPFPLPSFYPMHQIPMHQQTRNPYLLNQPGPIYFVPVRPNQNYNLSSDSLIDNTSLPSSRPPLHPQTGIMPPSVGYKEVMTGKQVPESVTKAYHPNVSAATAVLGAPSTQSKQPLMETPELQRPSQTSAPTLVASSNYVNEFDEDPAYTQIYKTQPPAPVLPVQYQTSMKGVTVLLPESSMRPQTGVKPQMSSHPQ